MNTTYVWHYSHFQGERGELKKYLFLQWELVGEGGLIETGLKREITDFIRGNVFCILLGNTITIWVVFHEHAGTTVMQFGPKWRLTLREV